MGGCTCAQHKCGGQRRTYSQFHLPTVESGHQTQVIHLVGQVPLSAKPSQLSRPLWPTLQWQDDLHEASLVIRPLLSLETYASTVWHPNLFAGTGVLTATWTVDFAAPPLSVPHSVLHFSSTRHLVGPSRAASSFPVTIHAIPSARTGCPGTFFWSHSHLTGRRFSFKIQHRITFSSKPILILALGSHTWLSVSLVLLSWMFLGSNCSCPAFP